MQDWECETATVGRISERPQKKLSLRNAGAEGTGAPSGPDRRNCQWKDFSVFVNFIAYPDRPDDETAFNLGSDTPPSLAFRPKRP
jgi:hypothetical protein